MHFVVFYIDVVVVVVVVVWYAPCEQQKTNTKQCKVLQILLIDRGTEAGEGEVGKGVHFAYHVAISESVTCAWRACIVLHLSRSISTPHSSGGRGEGLQRRY